LVKAIKLAWYEQCKKAATTIDFGLIWRREKVNNVLMFI
jgi:hypothetical protein